MSSEQPSPMPTPAATGPPASFNEFREFGSAIDAAIQAQDVDFFLRDAIISTTDCPNQAFECSTPIVGIVVGLWQSEAITVSETEFRQTLADELAAGPELYALATLTHDFGGAIGGPVDIAVFRRPDHKNGFVIFFEPSDATWRLKLLMNTGLPADESNPWLSGDCLGNCYDYWEPWEGVTP